MTATLSSVTVNTSETAISTNVSLSNTDGSFYAWYSNSNFTDNTNVLVSGSYTYYARMQYILTAKFSGSDSKIYWDNDSFTNLSSTTKEIILYENNTITINVSSDYKTVTLNAESTTVTMTGKYNKWNDTSTDRTFNDSSHAIVVNDVTLSSGYGNVYSSTISCSIIITFYV